MSATAKDGNGNLMRRMWEGERDDDGHRTWTLETQVTATSVQDGPDVIMACPDLPQIGDVWTFGTGGDVWAWCWPTMHVKYLSGPKEGEASYYWKVTQKFTTKPMHRCNVTQIANPLSEPFIISGNFVKYTREVSYDRYGNYLRSSSYEKITGPEVEFDFNRMSVKIAWNVGSLDLGFISQYIDTVNDSYLWGVPPRCVKLSAYSFERVLYSVCTFYYKQTLEFDIDFNSFDRQVLDTGTRALHGQWVVTTGKTPAQITAALNQWRAGVPLPTGSLWQLLPINGSPPNRDNPQHYDIYKDKNGEIAKCLLDGNGEPSSYGNVPGPWTPGTQYVLGSFVTTAYGVGTAPLETGNIYICVSEGTSATSGTGPSGTTPGVIIVDGSCSWEYLRTADYLGNPPGSSVISYYPQTNMLNLGIPTSL